MQDIISYFLNSDRLSKRSALNVSHAVQSHTICFFVSSDFNLFSSLVLSGCGKPCFTFAIWIPLRGLCFQDTPLDVGSLDLLTISKEDSLKETALCSDVTLINYLCLCEASFRIVNDV